MKIWLQACRVNSLAISSIGVFVGTAVAIRDGHFDWLRFLLAWIGSVVIQAGTNLINVYYNYKAGVASGDLAAYDPRGSSAVIRKGLLTPAQVHAGAMFSFAAGVLCGLTLTWLCGWTILWLGLPAVLAGYSYAGPPIKLGYWGLGVITVFVFMGPVMVCGAYYVQTGTFSLASLLASIPIGLVAAGIMLINDLRDYDSDVIHRKRTLATLLGQRGAANALALMDVLAFAIALGAVAARILPWPALLVLLAVPPAVSQIRTVLSEREAAKLHLAWLAGVKLHMQFGVLMILGLLLRRY